MNTVNNLINWIKSVLTMMSGTANNIDDTASVYAVHILRTVGFFLLICGLFVAAKMVVGVYVASALIIYDISFLRLAEIMSKYRAYTTDVKPSDI